jgi:RNA polymerase sigma-70 factor (ECF subfamily)
VEAKIAAVVQAAQADDSVAFGCLVERHWREMVRLARSVAGDDQAEDVAQDAFVAAWQSLHQLEHTERFRSWLARIVYRRAVQAARWRRLRVAIGLEHEKAVASDPDSAIDLASLLARLAPRQRVVLHLTVVEEMSDGEIGEVLAIAPASVRAHRRRARERLAVLMQGRTSTTKDGVP